MRLKRRAKPPEHTVDNPNRTFPLDQTKLAITLLGTIADGGLSIPGLKVACGIADAIIDIALSIRENREDCSTLAQFTRDSMVTFVDAMRNRTLNDVDEALKMDMDRFTAVLEEIRVGMVAMASCSLWKRGLKVKADRRKIQEFEKRLDQAYKTFFTSRQIAAYWAQEDGGQRRSQNQGEVMEKFVQVEEKLRFNHNEANNQFTKTEKKMDVDLIVLLHDNHNEAMERLAEVKQGLDVGVDGIKKILGCVIGPLADQSVRTKGLFPLDIYTPMGGSWPRIKTDIDARFFLGLNFFGVL